MAVKIKQLNVEMELKNKGIELEVRDKNDNHLGDLYIDKANIEWCKGKTHSSGGKSVNWEDFVAWFESR